jgi:hypothetical protein
MNPRQVQNKSSLLALSRTKITSFNPPLVSIGTGYPTPPLLALFEPVIELACRPCGCLTWMDFYVRLGMLGTNCQERRIANNHQVVGGFPRHSLQA